jgi:hypothetical protein
MSATRRFLLSSLLALACLIPAASASAATSVQTPWFGFNDLSGASGAVPFDTAASLSANAGATSTRMTIDWSWIEPRNDSFSWGMFDGVYWRSLARGVRPLIGITGAPRWAWDASATCPATSTCAYPPGRSHDADYQDLVRRLVARYPQAVGIEIGNEPNLSWAWAGGLDPARYTELVKLGYDAVKSVNPGMPVIAGALAPVLSEVNNADTIGLRPYLQAMYDNGIKGHMDAIAVHPYPHDVDFGLAFKALSITKETRTANGDDVPLWLTEYGLSTTGPEAVSENDQATSLPALYNAFKADPEIDGIYVHSLVGFATALPEDAGWGMVRADLTPKPAYCAFAATRLSSWVCPATVAKTVPSTTQNKRWDAQVILQAAADAARSVHVARGAYRTVTAADLNAVNPAISAQGVSGDIAPGATANPAQVGVFPVKDGRDGILLCNASKADRSYCIYTFWRGAWTYGSTAGTLNATAGATAQGATTRW